MKNLMTTLSCYAFLLIFIPAVTTVDSCDKKKRGNEYKYPDAVIEMTKTACFGACPEYTISLDGKGNAHYTGKRNVDKTGKYEKRFSSEAINTLISAFEEANFWDFEDEYTANVTDLPTTYISYERNGKVKKIKDYFGSPDSLKALEKAVESLANSEGWEAVADN